MSTLLKIPELEQLVEYLEGLTQRAPVQRLEEHLRAMDLKFADIAAFAQFGERQYVRNLVYSGEWYHVLVLCWRSGQRSPIHNHAGSTCGVHVLKGTPTETAFATTPCGQVKAVSSQDLTVGDVLVTQDSGIHQVSNLQAKGNDAVTLHVYSPPLLRMDTFSLTDAAIGEYRPTVLEHTHGSGI